VKILIVTRYIFLTHFITNFELYPTYVVIKKKKIAFIFIIVNYNDNDNNNYNVGILYRVCQKGRKPKKVHNLG
jgi:hypothetical protein